MLINILLIFFFILIINDLFLANKYVEGYMAVIGPIITPKEKTVSNPTNTYYKNTKITQDFDPDSVITRFN
jgi:hypothetical protein